FLDDYASLITALITVQEISGEQKYLLKARELTEYVIEHFSEPDTGFFFYTHRNQQDVIIRKKEVYDGAVPSGNSQMMYNLHYLSVVFDKKSWSERVEKVLSGFYQVVQEYPGSFGNWAGLILERTAGTRELVVVGKDYPRLLNELLRKYLPFRVLQSSSAPDGEFPLLTGKPSGDFPVIYNCFGYQCQPPVKTVEELF
ncbi:MAG TPA: thioredoxin domain-containing protein, partial [Parasegetibacter sp.]